MLKGKIIVLKDVVVVPRQQTTCGWYCIVVHSQHTSYPVGGYDLFVTDTELNAGNEFNLSHLFPDQPESK